MASASGIRAGAAFIELSVNDSKLIKGLRSALARLKSFGSGLENIGSGLQSIGTRLFAAGAGLTGALLASAKGFAEIGDQLDKMSMRTGVSVEALSELGYAAKLSGASLEDVEKGVRQMQRAIAMAAGGSKAAQEALADLGLSAEQIKGLSPEQQFMAITQRLNQIEDPTLRAAAAMKIFGRAGTSLIPMLKDLPALRAEARRLGLVMSTEDAKAAAELNDAMDRLWASLKMIVVTIGSALAPLLTEWAGYMTSAVGSVRQWLSANQGLVISLLKIGGIVMGVGASLTALGGVLSLTGTAFATLTSVATAALGFVLTPVGLVTTAVAGLGAYLVWASGAGGDALRWLGDRFDDLKSFALESFQGIKDALAAGDIALAGRVLWLSLQVAWRAGINTLKGWWLDFKDFFFQTTTDAFYGAVVLVADAFYGLQSIWEEVTFAMANAWTAFSEAMQFGWRSVQHDLEKGLYDVIGLYKEHTKLFMALAPGLAAALELSGFAEIDTEQAKKSADQEFSKDANRLSEERSNTLIGREKAHKQRVQEIQDEKNGTLKAINDMADAEDNARRRASASGAQAQRTPKRRCVSQGSSKTTRSESSSTTCRSPSPATRHALLRRRPRSTWTGVPARAVTADGRGALTIWGCESASFPSGRNAWAG